jgi:hypothetical protein
MKRARTAVTTVARDTVACLALSAFIFAIVVSVTPKIHF